MVERRNFFRPAGLARWIGSTFVVVACFVGATAAQGTTERASVSTTGEQADSYSFGPSLSADGRLVCFTSDASNLDPGDTNTNWDVFVHDRTTGRTQIASLTSSGASAMGAEAMISGDGRYVAFESLSANFVAGDTNGTQDIFVKDLQTGQVQCASSPSPGVVGDGSSLDAAISHDGRFVVYESNASNLVPGGTNGGWHVFAYDRVNGQITLVSVDSAGNHADQQSSDPAISADGRFVAFQSLASNLVPGDTNLRTDAFVHDLQTGQTSRASVSSAGVQGNLGSYMPSISGDGRFVTFVTWSSNLVPGDTNGRYDAFVHSRLSGSTVRVSIDSHGVQGNDHALRAMISADGRYVTLSSRASNLVPGDVNGRSDVFLHDCLTRETTRMSRDHAGSGGDSWSDEPALSADGRVVVFHSEAANLVPEDTNGTLDVFVRDRLAASATSRNAGTNPASHTAVTRPVLGETYTAGIDLGGTTGHDFAWLVGYSMPATVSLGGGQTLLVDVLDPAGELLSQATLPGPVATYQLPVPYDTALFGTFLATQALHLGGVTPFALSNAQDLVLGH